MTRIGTLWIPDMFPERLLLPPRPLKGRGRSSRRGPRQRN